MSDRTTPDLPSPADLARLAAAVIERLQARHLWLATAESCTGGLIAATLTDVPGASTAFERGFVTYSNQSKIDMLGVPGFLIDSHGAVSEPVAEAMAAGARLHAGTDLAVAVTGIAGPGGGSDAKPVGLVHIATAKAGHPLHSQQFVFPGDRAAVRRATVAASLQAVLDRLN